MTLVFRNISRVEKRAIWILRQPHCAAKGQSDLQCDSPNGFFIRAATIVMSDSGLIIVEHCQLKFVKGKGVLKKP